MSKLLRIRVALLVMVVVNALAAFGQAPKAVAAERNFEFGKVVRGATIEYTYVVRNSGDAPLKIENVSMTAPLRIVKVQATVAPGAETQLKFALDTAKVTGSFDGVILLTINDPATPEVELRFAGRVVDSIEVTPRPALVLVAQKGKSAQAALELVNHESGPVEIADIQYPQDRIGLRMETVEKGRRYRLHFTLSGQAASGRHEDFVVVRTTSKQTQQVKIPTYTMVRERVYTFPDTVDMGTLRLRDIRDVPRFLEKNAQTLMVYQVGGTEFRVNVRSDVPGLLVTAEPGPKGDRFQITATLERDAARKIAAIEGNIYIETNDKEFPKLVVPVRGQIVR